jgi:hypothetical protein
MYPDAEAGWLLTKIELSNVSHETSLLLVNFNVGEDLDYTEDKKHIEQTVSCVSVLVLELPSLPFTREHLSLCHELLSGENQCHSICHTMFLRYQKVLHAMPMPVKTLF